MLVKRGFRYINIGYNETTLYKYIIHRLIFANYNKFHCCIPSFYIPSIIMNWKTYRLINIQLIEYFSSFSSPIILLTYLTYQVEIDVY